MKRSLLLIAASIPFVCKSVSGDTAPPRTGSFCGYVGGRIYCWSGDISTNKGVQLDPNIYSLDINRFIGQKTVELSSKWEKLVPSTPFDPEPRVLFNAIVLPDNKRLLINGGRTSTTKLTNQTIIYHTTNNSWEKSLDYVDPDRGVRQILAAAPVNLPNGFVGFYGGLEMFTNITAPQTNNSLKEGFRIIIGFSPEAKVWLTPSPQLAPPAIFFPNAQTAVFHADSGKVYYIGGSYYTSNEPFTEKKISFGWAHTFDTKTGIWFNQTLGGTQPTRRDYHTTILLPNSPDILLYGGTEDYTIASLDYCSTLNLTNNEWTPRTLNIPAYISGPRFLHNSILVNTTLYVIFGGTLDGNLSSSIVTIDVASVSNITYIDTVLTPVISVTPDGNNSINSTTPEQQPPPSKGLSQGAIGGISGGAAAVVIAIVAFLYFRNRKKAKERKDYDHNEEISVDWDKIDNHYKELHVSSLHKPNTYYYSSEGSKTVKDTSLENLSRLYVQKLPRLLGTRFVGDRTLHGQQSQYGVASQGEFDSYAVQSSTDLGILKPSNDNKDIGHNLVKPDIA
ncbi:unnamed protein product [Mucor hiemalis]